MENLENKSESELSEILIKSKLIEIWKKVFRYNLIDDEEDFFVMGGDSLKMFRILSKIEHNFKINIPPSTFIKLNNIKAISKFIFEDASKMKEQIKVEQKVNKDKEIGSYYGGLTEVQMAYLTGRSDEYILGNISTHLYYEVITELDIKKLNMSLNQVIQHQPMLRAVFTSDGKQRILDEILEYKIIIEDVSYLSEKEMEKVILDERERMSHQIFNPEKWPLFEFKAFKLNNTKNYLCIGIDLLIADASSLSLLVGYLLKVYFGDENINYPTGEYTFLDYTNDINNYKNNVEYKQDIVYWQNKINELRDAPMLPIRHSLVNVKNPVFKRKSRILSRSKWKEIKTLCRKKGISYSSVLLTIYSKVLSFWSNQERFTLNLTVSNRQPFHSDVEKIIGDFTSVLLLDVNLSEEGFWNNARELQDTLLEALEHRHYDGVNVIREMSRRNENGQQVLMPIVFTSMLFSMDGQDKGKFFNDLGELKMGISQTSQVYLDYQVMELDGQLSIAWDYIEELFEKETIETMFDQYVDMLESLPKEKELTLSESDGQVVSKYNATDKEIEKATIQQLFKEATKKYPENIAVKANNKEITYKELDRRSNQVARYLLEQGIKKGDVVAVVANRDIDTIINTLGILKVGAVYVAVEPDYPKERINYILENSGGKILLGEKECQESKTYSQEQILGVSYLPEDIAYIIYTSGSTGKPKGVVITHDAALNTILDINDKFNVTEKDRVIGLSSMCFDLSVYDIFGSLISGATLIQVPDLRDIRHVLDIISREKITIWNSVPAIMDMAVENLPNNEVREINYWELEDNTDIEVSYGNTDLRLILLSGDWIPLNLPKKIKDYFTYAKVLSLGGATEASIWSIHYPIDEVSEKWNSIPYGYPLSNQTFYVLNHKKEVCPIGVEGELYIGGRGLALEYRNDKVKTEDAFIDHKKLGRLYKTGDYGKLHREGYIEFLGRKDQQVKINGHRIELGEIENQINSYKDVVSSVVVNRKDGQGKKYLCAYIVEEKEISYEYLEKYLKESLPEYMIPKYYVKIDEIPLNINGKVDKNALPLPNIKKDKDNYISPSTETEKEVAKIWEEILGRNKISIQDSFLKLGGDSIMMVRVISNFAEKLKVDISFKEFMIANTVKEISKIIDAKISSNKIIQSGVIYEKYINSNSNKILEFPLTDVQKAYLIGRKDDFELGGTSTHIYYEIETTWDINKLNGSLNELIKFQPMLRTIFTNEGNQKILEEAPEYKIMVKDISYLSEVEIEKVILAERERMSHHVFNPKKWPLFEFKALKVSNNIIRLIISIDLLILDGSSIRIFARELYDIYKGNTLEKLDFTFKDYVLAYENFKKSEIYKRDEEYWMGKIEGFPISPALPLKQSVRTVKEPHFNRFQKIVSKEKWNSIKKLAQEKNITPSALLCTIYAKILSYWSNQEELGLNVTVFTRYPFHADVEKIIGDFTSVMLLDVNLSEEGFWNNARKLQDTLLEALQHRHYDGVNVIREMSRRNENGQQVLMPIVFTSMLFSMEGEDRGKFFNDLGKIKMGVSQTSQVYLDYQVMELDGELSITWDYVEELFEKETIETMFEQYVDMLESLPKKKELTLSESDWQGVFEYNSTDKEIEKATIQQLFKEATKKYSENIAVKANNKEITYKELDRRSNQVARYLLEQGIKKGDVVAVVANRDIDTIINTLGILKVGAVYVAVEPDYPKERINYILENSGGKILLGEKECQESKVYSQKEILGISYLPEDIAYIIYTSGSTGRPKGVVITHDAALNTILDINDKFNVTEKDRVIGLSSMCFDLSVYDIFGSLISGATLIQVPDLRDIRHVLDIISREKITIWNSVPAIMDMAVENLPNNEVREINYWELEDNTDIEVSYGNTDLRLILLSGDWIPLNLPKKIKDYFTDANVISLGGATEASIWSIHYPIEEVSEKWTSIPYGYPLSNQTFYVLNHKKEICPIGVEGELYIGGRGLALEYRNDKEKTENAFIDHKKLGRLYKTGDYGKLHREGYIEFLGRKDQQVKINGHRIELGEIENQINNYKDVVSSVVVNREDEQGKKYLCAYIVEEKEISYEHLEKHLKESLPEYMIPKYYVKIGKIPLNINGKVDKKALPLPNIKKDKDNYIAPSTETEKEVAKIWEEVLGINKIGIHDSFLKLGGDSIMMVRVISKLAEKLKVDVSFKEFMTANTINKLSIIINTKIGESNLVGNPIIKYPEPKIDHLNKYKEFPLTAVQTAYFMGRDKLFELGGTSTHGYYEIETSWDINKLSMSLNQLIRSQPMLRAVFTNDGKQKILEEVPEYKIIVEDVSQLSEVEIEKAILAERERMSHHVFSPEKWPLFEFKAFKLNNAKNYLCMGIDLLIADGSSMRIIMGKLSEYYNRKESDPEIKDDYKENGFTFRDYVLAYERFKSSEIYKRDEAYWINKIEGFPSSPVLPLKQSIRTVKEPHFNRCQKVVPKEKWHRIKELAQEKSITPSALLCTIYAKVLSYWSNQEDLGINVTVFTRYPFHADVEKIIGDFTSIILLGVNLSEEGFWNNAKKLQDTLLEALEHRHYDGVNVIREMSRRSESGQHALMPIVFTSMLFSMEEEDRGNFFNDLGEIKMGVSQTSQVYLDYQVMELDGKLSITWDYVEELFEKETIEAMFEQYVDMLESLPKEKELTLSESDWQVVSEYNSIDKEIEKATIQQLFKEATKKYSENIAVKASHKEITYKELDRRSNQVARYLLEQGIKKGDVVAVVANRDIDTIINTLGILKTGAVYVAVEPDYPKERINYILENSGGKILLGEKECQESKVYSQKEILGISYLPEDIAYIIYTSGSTGRPKGVVITHDAALNTILDINDKFNVTERDRVIGLSSMCFDLSVYDIFGSLISGATLIQVPDLRDVKNIIEIIDNENITIWNSVPAIMEMFVDCVDIERKNNLRLILLSGDWIALNLPKKISGYFTGAKVISLGGATEASIWSIHYPIEEISEKWTSIPYGYPLSNQTFYVLNHKKEICPIGVEGELYIGGRGLALEYRNDKVKTEDAFIDHKKLGRLYKTGDYGKLHREGHIEFLGRKDQQVKINGHRIELGEIENQINSYKGIVSSVIVNREDEQGKKYLCAYIVEEKEIFYEYLERHLKESLPEYMIPKYYVKIDEIPLNINGKIDKKALPLPKIKKDEDNYIAPRTETEKEVAKIWEKVLEINKIGVHDSFFKIGGDSVSAINVYSELNNNFEITINDIFKYSTISKLSNHIVKKDKGNDIFTTHKNNYSKRIKELLNQDNFITEEINNYNDLVKKDLQCTCYSMQLYKNLLITGATGYLGSHIIKDLLKNYSVHLYLLVRSETIEKAKKKLYETFMFYFNEDIQDYADKFTIILGDISLEGLGITDTFYGQLSEKVDCIINCAAKVSHFGEYEEFYKVNVEGVKNIIEFSRYNKEKKLVHISTTYLANNDAGNMLKKMFTEYDIYDGNNHKSYYIQSKNEAESIIRYEKNNGLDIDIIRVGNISFNTETCRFQINPNENAFYSLLKSYYQLKIIPQSELEFLEFTNVNQASKAICLLTMNVDSKSETYHVCNMKKISLNCLYSMSTKKFDLKRVHYLDFIDFLKEKRKIKKYVRDINNIMNHMYLLPWNDKSSSIIMATKTDNTLNGLGFEWEELDQVWFDKMAKSFNF